MEKIAKELTEELKKQKTALKKKIFGKKILFFYFHPILFSYTPLDLGYVLAKIEEESSKNFTSPLNSFHFQFTPINFIHNSLERTDGFKKAAEKFCLENEKKRVVRLVEKEKPAAIFFFLDNVLWSGFWGLNGALEIVKEIRKSQKEELKNIFIGFQSYKITGEVMKKVFDLELIDCWVGENPALSFFKTDKILKKEKVANVYYHFNQEDFRQEKEARLQRRINLINQKGHIDDFIDEQFPSPYLTGTMDSFFHSLKNIKSAYLYSSFGCVFGCYYCFRSIKFSKLQLFSPKRFYDEIEYIVSKFGIHRFSVLDDFFITSEERLRQFVDEFEKRKKKNKKLKEVELFIMARIENFTSQKIAQLLKKINVWDIQIGLQTINPKLEKYMRRKEGSYRKLVEIAKWLKEAGIYFKLDIIAGLPGDDIDYFKKTVDFGLSLKPSFIQVKQLYLNPGTLFHLKRDEFGIEDEGFLSSRYKFGVPFVLGSNKENRIGRKYFKEAFEYVMDKFEKEEKMGFKILLNGKTIYKKPRG